MHESQQQRCPLTVLNGEVQLGLIPAIGYGAPAPGFRIQGMFMNHSDSGCPFTDTNGEVQLGLIPAIGYGASAPAFKDLGSVPTSQRQREAPHRLQTTES